MARITKPFNEHGFTLLEIMIALAILAITFMALLDLRNQDIARHLYSEHVTTATLLAQERLAFWELSGAPQMGEWSGSFPDFDEFAWKVQVIPTAFDFVREVRLLVFWNEGRRTERVEMSAYVFDAR